MKRKLLQQPAHTHRGAGRQFHSQRSMKRYFCVCLLTGPCLSLSLQAFLRHGVQCSGLHQRWLPCSFCPLPAVCCLTQQRLAFDICSTISTYGSIGCLEWQIKVVELAFEVRNRKLTFPKFWNCSPPKHPITSVHSYVSPSFGLPVCYCVHLSVGVNKDLLERLQLPVPDQERSSYSLVLVERLIRVMSQAAQPGTTHTLSTYDGYDIRYSIYPYWALTPLAWSCRSVLARLVSQALSECHMSCLVWVHNHWSASSHLACKSWQGPPALEESLWQQSPVTSPCVTTETLCVCAESKVRLATLELSCLLLKQSVLSGDHCIIKDVHLACLEVQSTQTYMNSQQ